MKKLITLALLALFGSAAWNSASAVLTQDGEGTYLITSPQDLVDFATLVNGGQYTINAKLQNDIDMTGVAFTPIGLSVDANADGRLTAYMGKFNGNGKTISNLSIETDDTNLYLIGLFSRVYKGTVSNLILKDVDIITAQPDGTPLATGGIAGIMDTGTLQNCAVIGFSVDETPKENSGRTSTGAICGYTISSNSTLVKYCFTDNATPIGALGKNSKVTNVYGAVDVAAKASTGELCYLLNGSQSDTPAWYQTLGSDPYPVLDSSHRVVYNSTAQTCDGTPKGDPTYSDVPPTRDPHNYVDGICSVCNSVDIPQVDGVFQIGTPQQLVYFSNYVNAQHKNVNAVLTADIDLTGINFTPIGLFTDDDADESRRFEGTFDGQGHVISNLYINRTDNYEVGLFSRPTNATIRNLGIKNASIKSVTTRDINSGVFAGLLLHSNMYNCYAIGDISIDITSGNVGGLATMATLGAPTGMYNCYTTYSTCGLIALGTCTLSNCYTNAEVAAKAATGELCYLLNGSQSETPTWYQTIGTDDYPVLDNTHGTVYLAVDQTCDGTPKGAAAYGNMAGVRDEHNFTDGICTVCGAAKEDYLVPEEGVFKIGTPAQLKWFAAYLNHGGESKDAVLTADLDFAGGEMIPIGLYSDGAYGGSFVNHSYGATFDGKGHVIKNVVISNDGDYEVGLFSRKSGGAIQNLGIDGITITNTSSNPRTGALAGLTHNANITNVYVVNATLSAAAAGETGALAGQAVGGTYTNCYTDNAAAFGGLSANLVNSYGADVVGPKGATGELCYLLNGDQSVITWYQTLGTDKYPVLDTTHKQVYKEGDYYTNVEGLPFENGSFVIENAAQLVKFSEYVNAGNFKVNGKLTADIDMESQAWTGISGFTGTLEGADFKISNLAGPLFATTGNGVKIQNLTLEGAITASTDNAAAFIAEHNGARINLLNLVNKTSVTSTANNVAAFIGKTTLSSNSANRIENCINEAAISGKDSVAAIIGLQAYSSGSGTECLNIVDCGNKAAISGANCVGGLVGANNAMLNYTRSWNEGAITGGDATGGLLGRNLRGWQYFRFCHNSGDVNGSKYVGGVMGDYNRGSLSYTTLEDCYNEGTVRGTGDNIGGLLGRAYVSKTSPFVLERCYNTGDVYGSKSWRPRALFHWTNAKVTMTDCWNIGEVKCIDGEFKDNDVYTMTYLADYPNNLSLTNSYDLANVAMAPKTGRPAGYEDAWLTNGAFTYYINDKAGKQVYYQTIGTDAHPVLDATHGIVNQITAAGYATQYIADTDVTIPVGVKAYTGKVNGDYLTLTEVTEKIPAAAAVVLEGAEGYYSFMPTTGADAVAENDLIGVTKKTAADGSQYVLAVKDEVVGFYQATEGDIVAGKAYLTGIPAGVKVVTFGTATSLTPALSEERGAAVYDLSGRRVQKAVKGIYIVNGKKILK